MGVTRKVLEQGNSDCKPKKEDKVTVGYTGYLYDEVEGEMADYRGKQFDSSADRGGSFKIAIGVGKVIRGPAVRSSHDTDDKALILIYYECWDEGLMEMSLGEKSVLTTSSDYAYGTHGFPDLIPPNSALIFEVRLIGINDTTAESFIPAKHERQHESMLS